MRYDARSVHEISPFLTKSAIELAAIIQRGEATSEQIVEAHLAHLFVVNPVLNAVVRVRARAARDEAKAADRKLREVGPDRVPLLHGVPCTIKESFELTGMPLTAGLVSRIGHRADRDATTVKRLRDAGAIPLGVTNVSELLMWMESNNRVYGRCNNPYDPSRIVGGSSGGEGAAVGAGIAPFGLGADIGGSIRLPAFFNGVFGHKPSSGLVPNTGQWPIAENEALEYLVTGPIARRAEDLWPLLMVLRGPDGACGACRDIELGDPANVDVSKLRVLNVPDNGFISVSDDLRAAQSDVARDLGAAGALVEERRFPRLSRSLDFWAAKMNAAADTSFAELMGGGKKKSIVPELARWLVRRSDHTLPSIMLAALEMVPTWKGDQARRIVADAETLRRELEDALGDDGVMLYPTYSRPAPRHYAPLLRPLDWVYTAIINVMGMPSTQVPLGLNDAGIPLGVQVIAKHGNDHLTIAVAQHLERTFGGWIPPRIHPAHRAPRKSHVPGVI
jgi:fatty acid amide hydrolase 2